MHLISLPKVTSLQFLEKLSAWSKNIIPEINSFSLIENYNSLSSNKNTILLAGANRSSTAIVLYFNPQEKNDNINYDNNLFFFEIEYI